MTFICPGRMVGQSLTDRGSISFFSLHMSTCIKCARACQSAGEKYKHGKCEDDSKNLSPLTLAARAHDAAQPSHTGLDAHFETALSGCKSSSFPVDTYQGSFAVREHVKAASNFSHGNGLGSFQLPATNLFLLLLATGKMKHQLHGRLSIHDPFSM